MVLSKRWLQDYLKLDVTDKDFAAALTLSGSKVQTTSGYARLTSALNQTFRLLQALRTLKRVTMFLLHLTTLLLQAARKSKRVSSAVLKAQVCSVLSASSVLPLTISLMLLKTASLFSVMIAISLSARISAKQSVSTTL